jgi:translation initiation factor IF-2
VEILGLEGLPQAGDQFVVVAEREKAREHRRLPRAKAREAALAKSSRVSLEGLAEQIKNEGTKQLDIILKGDVQGSVEVINDSAHQAFQRQVRIKVLRYSVGAITESDVLLAAASNAIIIGFNVRPERKAQEMAEQEKVDIRLHSIIYELQDEMKRAMTGLLEPTIKESYLGRAEVRDTFRIPKVGTVAGCQVRTASSSATPKSACCATTCRSSPARSDRSSASRTTPARSHARHGVRHLDLQLRRYQGRRHHRSLRHRENRCRSNCVTTSRWSLVVGRQRRTE